MKHCCKVKGEQVITLQIAQQLKTKNINVIQGQLFCRHCKAKFCQKQRLIVLMRKIKFNLLQILTMISLHVRHQEKASINWYFTCQFTCSTLAQQITNAKMKFDKVMNTIKRYEAIFQKHTKYNLTVWKIQNLILIIKIT